MSDEVRSYGNDVISTLKSSREQVRQKVPVWFGDTTINGALVALFEIITNGADELNEPESCGTQIKTSVDENYNIVVEDDGRGVPMAWNEKDERYNWDCVYNQLFSSGKGVGGAYSQAGGLNGVGAAITQYTAVYMDVISVRDEDEDYDTNGKPIHKYDAQGKLIKSRVRYKYHMHFENGFPVGKLEVTKVDNTVPRGTRVAFKTDEGLFQTTRFTALQICDRLNKLAVTSQGARIILNFMGKEVEFYYPEGPASYLEKAARDRISDILTFNGREFHDEIIKGTMMNLDVKVSGAFCFTPNNEIIECYHNNVYMLDAKGTPSKKGATSYVGFMEALSEVLTAQAQKLGRMKDTETLSQYDIEDFICCVICSSFHGDASQWDGQHKVSVFNPCLKTTFKSVVTTFFADWVSKHPTETKRIVTAIMDNRDLRMRAASVKKNLIKQLSDNARGLKAKPDKLTDCVSKNVAETEIYWVEGDSAKTTVVTARDKNTQACYPLTGKVLNCERAPLEVILNNKVCINLIKLHGCGIQAKSKAIKDLPAFDISKCNYGKFIIFTDADVDGLHITNLLLAFYYRCMPDLIKAGRVYICMAPLFRVNFNKDDYVYAYTQEELDQVTAILKQQGAKIRSVNRYKGLGEMDPEQMAESCLDPKHRRLIQVEWPDDEEEFAKLIHTIMGDNPKERKAWLGENYGITVDADDMFDENNYVDAVIDDEYSSEADTQ